MAILITGASGGIGREMALQLAAEGKDVILVARSEDKLNALKAEIGEGVSVQVLTADLGKIGAGTALLKRIDMPIDMLINNAGFGLFGKFEATDLATELSMIQLNIVAVTELSKGVLPGMIARKKGCILNVASTASFQPGPLMAVYYATKAYVLSFSEALSNELIGTGVTVTALCPGPTASGFQAKAALENSKLVKGLSMPTAAEVAAYGLHAAKRGDTVAIHGLQNWLGAFGVRFMPRTMVTALVRSVQEEAH